MNRRQFLQLSAGATAALTFGSHEAAADSSLEDMLREATQQPGIPGISACQVTRDGVVWSGSAGWADFPSERAMTPDTIQNIASISKTITATCVMQLVERGDIELDADASAYLPFALRHPEYPDTPITVRHLLTHHSSIKDGPEYSKSYACGDPTVTLRDWIESVLKPGGEHYHARQYFIPREPGERHSYSNIAYGALGLMVEIVANQRFEEYSREKVFAPLGMNHTGWRLSDVDVANYATPHLYVGDGRQPRDGLAQGDIHFGYQPFCLYSFPNYPDGLVRTSAVELGMFLHAYMTENETLLRPETYRAIFDADIDADTSFAQGLCWAGSRYADGNFYWGHSGGDPGVSTLMTFDPERGVGGIVLTNGNGHEDIGNIMLRLCEV